jgi:hypothetical protein
MSAIMRGIGLLSAVMFAAAGVEVQAEEVSGTIQNIDAASHTVTLADGTTYLLPGVIDSASLQIGSNVTIEFETDAAGLRIARSAKLTLPGPGNKVTHDLGERIRKRLGQWQSGAD